MSSNISTTTGSAITIQVVPKEINNIVEKAKPAFKFFKFLQVA
jgi:hypothetical protein